MGFGALVFAVYVLTPVLFVLLVLFMLFRERRQRRKAAALEQRTMVDRIKVRYPSVKLSADAYKPAKPFAPTTGSATHSAAPECHEYREFIRPKDP